MMSLEKQMRIAMRETLRSALEALGAQVGGGGYVGGGLEV
jgi:hypothetical protein